MGVKSEILCSLLVGDDSGPGLFRSMLGSVTLSGGSRKLESGVGVSLDGRRGGD